MLKNPNDPSLPTSDNRQQIEYWNGPVGQRWMALQERLDRMLAAINEAVLSFADPKPNEQVLDVGCGCGTTTLALQELTGVQVTGLDVSRPMLAVAARRSPPDGPRFVEGDAQVMPFSAKYDLVFSRFGVMFFSDPVAAFTNLRSALCRGGRLVFVCWQALSENPWASLPLAAAGELLPQPEPADLHAPGPFAFADPERVRTILTKAGYGSITIHPLTCHATQGTTLAEALDQSLRIGPLSRRAADLDETTQQQISQRVVSALAPYETKEGVVLPARVFLVRANRED